MTVFGQGPQTGAGGCGGMQMSLSWPYLNEIRLFPPILLTKTLVVNKTKSDLLFGSFGHITGNKHVFKKV